MKIYEYEDVVVTFKKCTAMFRERATGKILGVIVYNPEYYKWRYISAIEFNKKSGAINIYDD